MTLLKHVSSLAESISPINSRSKCWQGADQAVLKASDFHVISNVKCIIYSSSHIFDCAGQVKINTVSKAKEALRQECPAAKPIAGPRAVTMVATTGPHKGIAFKMTVGAAACFVGRSGGKKFREKGISLPKDNEVSTTHAKIELKNDQIVLVDVGSTNGTSVDGEPIEEGKPHPLAAGNTVVFGASTFTVSEIKAA